MRQSKCSKVHMVFHVLELRVWDQGPNSLYCMLFKLTATERRLCVRALIYILPHTCNTYIPRSFLHVHDVTSWTVEEILF